MYNQLKSSSRDNCGNMLSVGPREGRLKLKQNVKLMDNGVMSD